LPGAFNRRIEFPPALGVAATADPRFQVFGQAGFAQIQSLEYVGILMHFAYPVLVHVLLIFACLQFNYRMNGYVSHNMAGVS
jgi:hypothetical protein